MKSLILALFVILVLVSEAFPQQTRYRKNQPQEANIQPFIRFRKSAQPAAASTSEFSASRSVQPPSLYYYSPQQQQFQTLDFE